VLATSGTAASLAAVCHGLYKTQGSRASMVSRPQMQRIAKTLARLPLEGRRRLPGVGPRRAEIIPAGAVVYSEILDKCQLRGFRYSPLGLRDGILAQMAAEYDRSTRSGKQIESERADSIRAAVERYHVDRDHATQVRDAALSMFNALQSLHRLPQEYREWLSAAAMLYEIRARDTYGMARPAIREGWRERRPRTGNDTFREVSWDEALDAVAAEIKRVRAAYGDASIVVVVRRLWLQ